ncbi:MAG: PHP domain-containing protein [Candidatus Nanopelagicales bacterium]
MGDMGDMGSIVEPVAALEQIAYLLERAQASTYRVAAFRRAAAAVAALEPGELARLAGSGRLGELAGVGEVTATVINQALTGRTPAYLAGLEPAGQIPVATGGEALLELVRGDLHTHSLWSDGGSPIELMARTAQALGRDYLALTDHSPRLKVANGLTAERLLEQLEVVARLNEQLAPFRILTGIEVDILDDGSLDQSEELLARLDVVVASVHSHLRMPAPEMTRRLVVAVANPHTDVLGHCTGRLVGEKGRAQSEFDAEIVFEACRLRGVAVEVNSRPERLDPPRNLLRSAVVTGCLFAIDSDAHAPGQLDWLAYGCARAVECDVPPDRVVTTWSADQVVDWTTSRSA